LATAAPVWIAPAMNVHMYSHPAVKKNIETLLHHGCRLIEPGSGYLACGYTGKGRMEEPAAILEKVKAFFAPAKGALKDRTVLVTAGPTKERLDPVRYFTNRSSGKMGYALARQAASMGARVILISGSDTQPDPENITCIHVESAEEMYKEVMKYAEEADIIMKSAAVADYRPKQVLDSKMKKNADRLVIEMEKTKDILYELGHRKQHQFLVGFAAETDHVEEYAKGKLKQKNADMIVANNVSLEGAGFDGDTNIVTIYHKDGTVKELPLLSKSETAKHILEEVVSRLEDRKT
jgi:phosphopantothenoylcysteine decarboxylase/phosphopantothenate--cysteine ligase